MRLIRNFSRRVHRGTTRTGSPSRSPEPAHLNLKSRSHHAALGSLFLAILIFRLDGEQDGTALAHASPAPGPSNLRVRFDSCLQLTKPQTPRSVSASLDGSRHRARLLVRSACECRQVTRRSRIPRLVTSSDFATSNGGVSSLPCDTPRFCLAVSRWRPRAFGIDLLSLQQKRRRSGSWSL